MKRPEEITGSPHTRPAENLEYPDVISPDDPEEDNPTAYTLLSKIEDPYYSRKQSFGCTATKSSFHEENKSNLPIYKSFYSMSPTKSESSSSLNSPKDQETVNATFMVPRPLKGFQPKIFQEPKRHSSAKMISSPHRNPSATKSASQYYHSQLQQLHPTGVSTPPPPGMEYYNNNMPAAYNPYAHYSTNTLPQAFIHGFQGLSFEDQPATGYPYPAMPGYYPVYMGYPPQPPSYPQPSPGYYPSPPSVGTPKKKKSPSKPSQFRPPSSTFVGKGRDYGEHNAENEDNIIAIIKEFEENQSDFSILKGKIAELAVTQTGSRFLQKQLTKASPSFVTFVLEEIEKKLPNLMVDSYANYFSQRLLSSCSPSQRVYFIQQIKGKIVEISMDKKGTHTIQSMLDVMTMPEEEELVASDIKGHVFELASDQQATHVVQKALLTFADSRKEFIIEEGLEKLKDLANDPNGLCLVKKLLPICARDPALVKRVIGEMAQYSMDLAQNPYGNYAIQVAMDSFTTEQCAPLFDSLKGKYSQLSMLKFSSNAIEKCIEKADPGRRDEIIKEITNSEKLLALMKNSFGNYVVQKALNIADGDTRVDLSMAIQENITHLTDKKLKAKWTQILDKSLNLLPQTEGPK